MIVARKIDELKGTLDGSCVTIGNFDGVHLGHQELISLTCSKAKTLGLTSVVVTFDPHPLRVLVGKNTPPFITLTEQKLELLAELGPQTALVLAFDKAMAAMEPEEFVRTYLLDGLNMRELVIGYDYAMGRGRRGNYETLKALGAKYGFNVHRLEPVVLDDAVVSSTRIRDLVESGKVWEARALLGRFYQVRGRVVRGRDRGGRLLGFPTANLELADELFPRPGVYAVWVERNGSAWKGVANIGDNPTFGNDQISVEAHVLDFDQDIYGLNIRIHFVQRIRSERRFESIEALKARIGEDIVLARRILDAAEAQIKLTRPKGPVSAEGRPRP
ncbi:MAG: bifunctional riboflavin kinase/FAD synthetase [Desulfovibrionaceae bacterium]|nr:bifunctional riboflavin kinase/FAD synthetase [Desulfovibrionaceae bacterium]